VLYSVRGSCCVKQSGFQCLALVKASLHARPDLDSLHVDHRQSVEKLLKCSLSIQFSEKTLGKGPSPLGMYCPFAEPEAGGLILDPPRWALIVQGNITKARHWNPDFMAYN